MSKHRLLVVDDNEQLLLAAELLLKREFGEVVTSITPDNIPLLMSKFDFDVIMLDMNFAANDSSGKAGLSWLSRILAIDPAAVVIMITGHSKAELAVDAMKLGATDFIEKPWQNEKVIATVSSALRLRDSLKQNQFLKVSNQLLQEVQQSSNSPLIGQSAAMDAVNDIVARAAPTDANVLVLGENGTGKELIARQIHSKSLRKESVFMAIDVGAISESLFESELFGHKKGAFTGASQERIGKLVAANGGTLFLDEIGNISLHLQAKLLTILEQRKVTPVGANKSIPIDVRIIAATNASEKDLLDSKYFRQDLLYRLNTVQIDVPPLRSRAEDIPLIANHYLEFYTKKYKVGAKSFTPQALTAMIDYQWPGNVRALRHAIERGVILSNGDRLTAQDLQLKAPANQPDPIDSKLDYKTLEVEEQLIKVSSLNIKTVERELIKLAIKKHKYNITKAANELGLTRATLYRRIEEYKIE